MAVSAQPGILQSVPPVARYVLFNLADGGVEVPSTPGTLWGWLRGTDLGDLLHVTRTAQMRRMAGQDDGIVDAIFKISRPETGAYCWCPPMRAGRLDRRRLGL